MIIAADANKFIEEKDGHIGLLQENEWAAMISKYASRIFIVTSSLRPEVEPVKRAEFEQQIDLFRTAQINIDYPKPFLQE